MRQLAQYALELRDLHKTSTRQACIDRKVEMIGHVHSFLATLSNGVPPRPDNIMNFYYKDAPDATPAAGVGENVMHGLGLTPREFAYRTARLDEVLSNVQISSDPRHAHGSLLSFEGACAVIGGPVEATYLNVDASTFSQLIVASLQAGRPVHVEVCMRFDISSRVRDQLADAADLCSRMRCAAATTASPTSAAWTSAQPSASR